MYADRAKAARRPIKSRTNTLMSRASYDSLSFKPFDGNRVSGAPTGIPTCRDSNNATSRLHPASTNLRPVIMSATARMQVCASGSAGRACLLARARGGAFPRRQEAANAKARDCASGMHISPMRRHLPRQFFARSLARYAATALPHDAFVPAPADGILSGAPLAGTAMIETLCGFSLQAVGESVPPGAKNRRIDRHHGDTVLPADPHRDRICFHAFFLCNGLSSRD